jgi:hypothetical protein
VGRTESRPLLVSYSILEGREKSGHYHSFARRSRPGQCCTVLYHRLEVHVPDAPSLSPIGHPAPTRPGGGGPCDCIDDKSSERFFVCLAKPSNPQFPNSKPNNPAPPAKPASGHWSKSPVTQPAPLLPLPALSWKLFEPFFSSPPTRARAEWAPPNQCFAVLCFFRAAEAGRVLGCDPE